VLVRDSSLQRPQSSWRNVDATGPLVKKIIVFFLRRSLFLLFRHGYQSLFLIELAQLLLALAFHGSTTIDIAWQRSSGI